MQFQNRHPRIESPVVFVRHHLYHPGQLLRHDRKRYRVSASTLYACRRQEHLKDQCWRTYCRWGAKVNKNKCRGSDVFTKLCDGRRLKVYPAVSDCINSWDTLPGCNSSLSEILLMLQIISQLVR